MRWIRCLSICGIERESPDPKAHNVADGIRSRVARHLTSARSDIIANRQIDVWEIA